MGGGVVKELFPLFRLLWLETELPETHSTAFRSLLKWDGPWCRLQVPLSSENSNSQVSCDRKPVMCSKTCASRDFQYQRLFEIFIYLRSVNRFTSSDIVERRI